MAKKDKEQQKEFELEDNKKTQDTDGAEEVVVDSVQDKQETKVESDAEKRVKELQDQIAKVDAEKKLAVERADRLEKERSEATTKAQQAEGKAALTQKEAINQALSSAEKSLESYRKEYKAALEAGDSDKVVEAQERLSEAVYLQSELKKNKASFEQWEKQQEEISKQPKEARLPPSVQEWVARNPKYNSDTVFKAEADSAHDAALRRGYQFGSPAYIEFIDKRIEKVFSEEKVKEDAAPAKKEKEDSFSAPPSRGTSSGDDFSPRDVKLKISPEEAEAAELAHMSTSLYAFYRELGKAEKSGDTNKVRYYKEQIEKERKRG